ncbi:MAG: D-alanine--D-alanine ligase, D-alanine-D-alanine ligase [Chloroflexi bacterium]|nr:D-alanine--D-alanine ligase, D-alanine-D-alanine ligase [Chloroflexota bacterium]
MPNNRSKPAIKASEVILPNIVGIIYSDVQREDFPTESLYITEKDAQQDARLIGEYLETLGISVELYPGNTELPDQLRKSKPEMVINLVDSVKGKESLASAIPGVLELLDIPYTGADILGLSLDTNKFLIKKLLQQNGIPVPYYQLFNSPDDYLDPVIRFPLISKLNAIHGAVEITSDAVSENEKQLRKRLRYLMRTYKQPVLVEEFISGRELTAIVLHDKKKKVYLAEKVFTHPDNKYLFLTFEDQWLSETNTAFHYAKYQDPLLIEYVKKAFNVSKMADYAKFDIRLDQSGRYFFIDTNCNPTLAPKEQNAALSVILDMYGISFYEILQQLILNTVRDAAKKKRLAVIKVAAG